VCWSAGGKTTTSCAILPGCCSGCMNVSWLHSIHSHAHQQQEDVLHIVVSCATTTTSQPSRPKDIALTLVVCVALNSMVCRSLGSSLMICRISSSKPISRIRSASSMTKQARFLNTKPLVFCRWSNRRPGVATCGYKHSVIHGLHDDAHALQCCIRPKHAQVRVIKAPVCCILRLFVNASSAFPRQVLCLSHFPASVLVKTHSILVLVQTHFTEHD